MKGTLERQKNYLKKENAPDNAPTEKCSMARSGSVHFDGGRARHSPCLFLWKYFGVLRLKCTKKNQFSYFKKLSRVLEKIFSQTFNHFFEEKTIQKSKFQILCAKCFNQFSSSSPSQKSIFMHDTILV